MVSPSASVLLTLILGATCVSATLNVFTIVFSLVSPAGVNLAVTV